MFVQDQDGQKENKEEEVEEHDLNAEKEDLLFSQNRNYMKQIDEIQLEISNNKNLQQTSKVISILNSLKTSRGLIIAGPRCSGKTTLVKLLGLLLKKSEVPIDMKISMLNPDIYNIDKLYASADTGISNPEIVSKKPGNTKISSITSSVLKIILEQFDKIESESSRPLEEDRSDNSSSDLEGNEEEKRVDLDSQQDEQHSELPKKIVKTLLFECSTINSFWSDCLIDYFKEANKVSDLNSPLIDNLDSYKDLNKYVPVHYPNGATALIPKDLFMFFECDSLANASPSFLSQVSIITTDETTVTWEHVFGHENKKLEKFVKSKPFCDLNMPYAHFENTINEFVIPFIKKLNSTARIKSNSFWKMKSLVIRFFKFLDGQLTNLL